MKNSKLRRVLMLMACAVLLVCLSVGATLAYLTSTTGVVKNTFTVGKVLITLDEAQVDLDGDPAFLVDYDEETGLPIFDKLDSVADADRVMSNKYKLMPGHKYTKDPTVHVTADSENCYIFVKVENGIVDIEAQGEQANPTIATQMTTNGWVKLNDDENIYYYTKDGKPHTANAGQDLPVFSSFKISSEVVNGVEESKREDGKLYITDYTTEDNGTLVTVIAYAIQADGFNTPAEAWDAGNFQ